jgi:hypothetical protein
MIVKVSKRRMENGDWDVRIMNESGSVKVEGPLTDQLRTWFGQEEHTIYMRAKQHGTIVRLKHRVRDRGW